jgi:hypothetical protein
MDLSDGLVSGQLQALAALYPDKKHLILIDRNLPGPQNRSERHAENVNCTSGGDLTLITLRGPNTLFRLRRENNIDWISGEPVLMMKR